MESIDDDVMKEEPMPPKRGRRQAVAAESYDPDTDESEALAIVVHEKSKEQLLCLKEASKGIVFFEKCDEEQKDVLFKAMFEKRVKKDEVIIKQGDDGDNFYVIEEGQYSVIVNKGGQDVAVATINDKGFFGELALLYNCPRNATIKSLGDGVLWGLDQKTFRQVVVKATAKKRQLFEELLKGVSILSSLATDELSNLTDALFIQSFQSGETIIKEGDQAEMMYFVMDGKVLVRAYDTKKKCQKDIVTLERGKYFGELALVLKKPRVASVVAESENVKLAVLSINAFERLLGPCINIMKRNIVAYEHERKKLGINSIGNEFSTETKSMNNMKIK